MVRLRSGTWRWNAQAARIGTVLHYVGVERRGEMSSWSAASEITRELAKAGGVDPAVRIWTDGVGLRWEISLEPIRSWNRHLVDPGAADGEFARLLFVRALPGLRGGSAPDRMDERGVSPRDGSL